MSNKKLIVLSIVAGLMILWAVAQSRISSKPKSESSKPTYLIQGLDPAEIGSIVIGADKDTVTLKRQDNHFVVADKDNYPADTSKVNELITKCLDIRTTELYTDNKTNHKDLGVTEKEAERIVKFFKADSSLLTGVVVGKTKEQGRGSFVRLASNDKVYVATKRPWFNDRAMDYIDQKLISMNRSDIESVTISGPNEVYTLKAGQDSKSIILENLPPGKKLKDTIAKSVFGVLTNLRFNDVQKESAVEGKLNFNKQLVCRLQDSTVYRIKIAQQNNKTYITCEAEFTDKTPITQKGVQDANEAELKEKEARLLAQDKANEFSAKHKGWIYEIPEYKANNMTKRLSELLEAEPESKEPGQTGEPNSAKK